MLTSPSQARAQTSPGGKQPSPQSREYFFSCNSILRQEGGPKIKSLNWVFSMCVVCVCDVPQCVCCVCVSGVGGCMCHNMYVCCVYEGACVCASVCAFVCVCPCACAGACACVCLGQKTPWIWFSPATRSSEDGTQMVRLGSKCLCWLSHLEGPQGESE